jgi:hypothetical protein
VKTIEDILCSESVYLACSAQVGIGPSGPLM